ncbi:MAG: hypothetical protein EBV11_05090, partial [Actinobacteria bacterium]|nr:hypothetical protein [Actinomycetota bacterium]
KAKALDLLLLRGATELSESAYVEKLLSGVADHLIKIDELITTYAQDWDMDRMPAIDRNILRIAIFEILWVSEVDLKVACDEAVADSYNSGAPRNCNKSKAFAFLISAS